jgi:hypothetical protein
MSLRLFGCQIRDGTRDRTTLACNNGTDLQSVPRVSLSEAVRCNRW